MWLSLCCALFLPFLGPLLAVVLKGRVGSHTGIIPRCGEVPIAFRPVLILLEGPTWALHYTCMGVASWTVYYSAGGLTLSLVLYVVQLFLNWVWTFEVRPLTTAVSEKYPSLRRTMVLRRRDPVVGCVLWLLLQATALAFARWQLAAGVLMMPAVSWVSVAQAATLAGSTWSTSHLDDWNLPLLSPCKVARVNTAAFEYTSLA